MYIYSGGFWHGRTGQPPGAAFSHDTWGRPIIFFYRKKNAYNLQVFVFSELCEMAKKIGNTKRLCGGELV